MYQKYEHWNSHTKTSFADLFTGTYPSLTVAHRQVFCKFWYKKTPSHAVRNFYCIKVYKRADDGSQLQAKQVTVNKLITLVLNISNKLVYNVLLNIAVTCFDLSSRPSSGSTFCLKKVNFRCLDPTNYISLYLK